MKGGLLALSALVGLVSGGFISEEELTYPHQVCENAATGEGATEVTLESFDATRNGGRSFVTVMMSVFSGCNPGRVDVPAFAHIAERISGITDDVAFLVSAKGGGACTAWADLALQKTKYPLIVQDNDRRLHYAFFDYHPQFVILDKHMNVRHKFGSKEIAKIPDYVLELLGEPDVNLLDGEVGAVSLWSEWSTCPVRCGGGTQQRTREIISVGNNDDTPALFEQRKCNRDACNTVLPQGTQLSLPTCAPLLGSAAGTVIIASSTGSPDSNTNMNTNTNDAPQWNVPAPLTHTTDVQFHSLKPNEMWVSNAATDSFTIFELNEDNSAKRHTTLRDRHPYHYMDQISSFSFDKESSFFATCQLSKNTYDGRMNANNFQGPTLYDADPKWLVDQMNEHSECGSNGLYGMNTSAMECYLSHHDMLHEAPECAGIVHDPEHNSPFRNVYWAFAGQDGHLVRFDFEKPHGPGSMDHALASVRRYTDVALSVDPTLPGHLAIDNEHRVLYISNTNNGEVLVVDMESSQYRRDARTEYPVFSSQEPTFEYSLWGCTVSDVFAKGLDRPTGIALSSTVLYVAEYGTGHIHAYSKSTGEKITTYDTGLGVGLTSLTISPSGNKLFFTHTRDIATSESKRGKGGKGKGGKGKGGKGKGGKGNGGKRKGKGNKGKKGSHAVAAADGHDDDTYTDEGLTGSRVGYVHVEQQCAQAASTYSLEKSYFDGKGVRSAESQLCLSEAESAGMSPVFEHDPGYMNMGGITDEYTDADCDSVNFDAILLNGYFCHKCLRNPCSNDADCIDHRYVGYTCNCSSIESVDVEENMQYTGDKCQIKKECGAFSALTCESISHADEPTRMGDPIVCGIAKHRPSEQHAGGVCIAPAVFLDAQMICDEMGARLCTVEEVHIGEISDTGCAGDNARVWVQSDSEDCDQEFEAMSVRTKKGSQQKKMVKKCESNMFIQRAVRCCADALTTTNC